MYTLNQRNNLRNHKTIYVLTPLYQSILLSYIKIIFFFKTAGNQEMSCASLLTFVTEKSGAIRPACFLAGGPTIHHGDWMVNGLCNSVPDE